VPAGADAEVLRVVENTDVVANDLLAADWTDEPWTDPTTGVAAAFPPAFSGYIPIAQANVAAGGNFGTSSNPPDPTAVNQVPPLVFVAVQPSCGQSPAPDYVHQTPPSGAPAVITVQIVVPNSGALLAADSRYNPATNTFTPTGDTDTPMTLSAIGVSVVIAGGPAGVGTFSITGPGIPSPQLGTYGKGDTPFFTFSSVPFLPGSTISYTASYTINSVTYTGTGSYTFPGWQGWTLPTAFILPPSFTVTTGIIDFSATPNGSTVSGDTHAFSITGFAGGTITSGPTPNPVEPGTGVSAVLTAATIWSFPVSIAIGYAYPDHVLSATISVHADGTWTATGDYTT
jgi:hypothetical protein